ncbi:hypothetical protein Slin14017_G026010 [Septoria linicola]|nr:hypothetical protein Slin14017_G026010 [Septoria linicola]
MSETRRFRTRSRAGSTASSSVVRASLAAEAQDWHDSFLEDPIVVVQVPLSDIPDYVLTNYGDSHPALNAISQPRRNWYGRRVSHTTQDTAHTIAVRMRRSEYAKHFAKDRRTGDYLEEVEAPPEGRDEWVVRRLQFQKVCGSDDVASQGSRSRASSMATRRVEEWFGKSQVWA